MTERALSISTQVAPLVQTAFNSAASAFAHDALANNDTVEEEPYTIKCICDYLDDDGNTIYCEACDTWQHIECYYPGRAHDASKPDFVHSCVDCNHRHLDLNRAEATARQRDQRHTKANTDSSDKKHKRPPSKSHKKKVKATDAQTNGYHERDGHSPQDTQHAVKKAKSHHRNSQSTSQIKRSPPYNARPSSHGLPPSPVHTPPDLPAYPDFHGYSDHFTTLYDNDETVEINNSNKFARLNVTDTLAAWLQDPIQLMADVGIDDRHKLMPNLKKDANKRVPLRHERTPIMVHNIDRELICHSIITPQKLEKDAIVGELNGIVGFQIDLNDVDNPVEGYAHPKPFIFYVPRLPIYIDTRTEGSVCRYVRRSCRSNTTLETFIGHGSQYHFWLVSDRAIAANEQITMPWDFRFPKSYQARFLHFMNLVEDEVEHQPLTGEEYENLSGTINLVLSDHGGCACGLGNDCAFARFHQNYLGRLQANGVKSKKVRKSKQSHVSPTSTGHATNSRAASEGHQEQYDEDDRRSVSGSSRSKPNSRDLTPLHGVGESNNILTGVSGREKRKLALYEESFRKMDNQTTKKKRMSDGSTINSPSASSKPRQKSVAPRPVLHSSTTNGSRKGDYVDAGTSRRQSGSPSSAISPNGVFPPLSDKPASYRPQQSSNAHKATYADSSTQTDDEEDAWYSASTSQSTSKRPIIPLSKRLLRNRHKIRLERQVQRTPSEPEDVDMASPTLSRDFDTQSVEGQPPGSPVEIRRRHSSITSSSPTTEVAGPVDITMADSPPLLIGTSIKPPPPPWPGSTIGALPRLHVPPQTILLPGGASGATTPISAIGSALQSPLGSHQFPGGPGNVQPNGIGAPSPVKMKKKMSLSDYKLKNAKKAEPSTAVVKTAPETSPGLATIDEATAPGVAGVVDAPAVMDTVMEDKTPVAP